jgi:rSAM/selenodomain-associated transferase 1
MDHLGMFAKFWAPGKVKTRLAATIGEVQAAEVYRAMLSYLVDSLRAVGDRRTIAFTPSETRPEFAGLRAAVTESWTLLPQSEGSLGERMTHFFDSLFSATAASEDSSRCNAILIGSDCPSIAPKLCQEAFELLRTHEVVLGPTPDGGYYLVGMSGQYRDVFSGITYSTESVLDQTIRKMQDSQIKYALLPPREDIDEFENLVSLRSTFLENRQPAQADLLSAIEDALAAGRSS